ncbi:hypothetical protein [uncultured Jatrophihabitans sp.]|uniref:hypothetical protein n=1 Tax=uncultured Jatrophihabitans sp. TaxID=1610747 RepID=UPI0035CB052C
MPPEAPAGSSTGSSTGPPRRPLLFWSALLVALAALVGGAVVAVTSVVGTQAPAGAVRGYFDALQHADAPRALGFGDVPSGSRVLLTSAVLREQRRNATIVDVHVATVRHTGSRAVVPVSYTLRYPGADVPVSVRIPVHDSGSGWRLDAAAVRTQLTLRMASQRASVLGHEVPTTDVLAFPGAPPVRFDTAYLALDPDSGIVPGRSGARTFDVVATAAGRRAMQAAVLAAITRCLSDAHPAVTCPLPDARYVPGSVHGRPTGGLSGVHLSLDVTEIGRFDLTATVAVAATSYQRLDFHNRASTGRGRVTLDVHALAAARPLLTITWLPA